MPYDANGLYIPSASEAPTGGYRMTAEQALEYARTGVLRADSVSGKLHGGLIRQTIVDEFSGARRYEYSLPAGVTKKDTWMSDFMTAPRLQIAIANNSPQHEIDRVAQMNLENARAQGWTNE